MKKIITVLVSICMILTTMVHDVCADGFDPWNYDFLIYTDEFISAYYNGVWQQTGYFTDKDLDTIEGIGLDYNNGEYTLNITRNISFNANKDICSSTFDEFYNSMIYVLSKKLKIVGEGTLTLVMATDDFDNNSMSKCISLLYGGDLNIESSNNDNRLILQMLDESTPAKKIDTTGIHDVKSNISINNAVVIINTSKSGIEFLNPDNEDQLNINNSDINISCKENLTNTDYYGITNDGTDSTYISNFINSEFYFSNPTNKNMYCIKSSDKIYFDGCEVNADNGTIMNLLTIEGYNRDIEKHIEIKNSIIEAQCLNECIASYSYGDLFIEDSYIDFTSIGPVIQTINNVNIKYTSDCSTITKTDDFIFSINTSGADRAIVYEYDDNSSRDRSTNHHVNIDIAPTLNIFYSEYPYTDDNPLYDDINITQNNVKTITLKDTIEEDSKAAYKYYSIKKVAGIISFDLDGGTPNYDPIIVENYGDIDLNNYKPTKSGYDFGGWYGIDPYGTIEYTTPLSEFVEDGIDARRDETFRAKWIKKGGQSSDSGKHIVLDTGVN